MVQFLLDKAAEPTNKHITASLIDISRHASNVLKGTRREIKGNFYCDKMPSLSLSHSVSNSLEKHLILLGQLNECQPLFMYGKRQRPSCNLSLPSTHYNTENRLCSHNAIGVTLMECKLRNKRRVYGQMDLFILYILWINFMCLSTP